MSRLNKSNFFETTTKTLLEFGLKEADVEWVGSADGKFAITWEKFGMLAKKIDQDMMRWGGDYVPYDLVIVGKDFWLERVSDEQNWPYWRLCKKPMPNQKTKEIKKLFGWNIFLKDLN